MSLNRSKVFWVEIPKYRKVAVVTLFTSSLHHHLTWLRGRDAWDSSREVGLEFLQHRRSAAVPLASLKSGLRMYLVTTLKFGYWSIKLIQPKFAFRVYPFTKVKYSYYAHKAKVSNLTISSFRSKTISKNGELSRSHVSKLAIFTK